MIIKILEVFLLVTLMLTVGFCVYVISLGEPSEMGFAAGTGLFMLWKLVGHLRFLWMKYLADEELKGN